MAGGALTTPSSMVMVWLIVLFLSGLSYENWTLSLCVQTMELISSLHGAPVWVMVTCGPESAASGRI